MLGFGIYEIRAINTWTVAFMRYGARVVLRMNELQGIYRRVRQLMTMNKSLTPPP